MKQRLRLLAERRPASKEHTRAKTRAEIVGNMAELARRGADAYLEAHQGRGRIIARISVVFGLAGVGLIAAATLGYGDQHVMGLLAGCATLVPTTSALARAGDGQIRIQNVGIDRGVCQAVALQARHLGESVDAADERTFPLSADGVINSQVDLLFRSLDRCKQRLLASGADVGTRGSAKGATERIVPDQTQTFLETADGRRYPLRIVEVSLGGVVLRGGVPPLTPNDLVQVGARKARLADRTSRRVSLAFVTPIVKSELNAKIVL